jgi:hypothetical protein
MQYGYDSSQKTKKKKKTKKKTNPIHIISASSSSNSESVSTSSTYVTPEEDEWIQRFLDEKNGENPLYLDQDDDEDDEFYLFE